jgi:oligopeptide/dipeptide ABC transporter ATP-binding protein
VKNDLILEVRNLETFFYLSEGTVRAVDGISFDVREGRTLGVVGESGCGKSVTAQSILQIVPAPGRITGGEILFHQRPNGPDKEGRSIIDISRLHPRGKQIRAIRGKEISMIFQEPMTSFSPVHTIGNQIIEAILLHQKIDRKEARDLAIDLLKQVGIPHPERRVDDYPNQLSGGMRQRAMIAMALSCNPSLLIADEPTTALDVTIQAQILGLLEELQERIGMSIMIITHDLGVVSELSDDVVVMYWGKMVEYASVDTAFYNPLHPYTKALLKSIPKLGKRGKERLEPIRGSVPDPFETVIGCAFFPRCPEGTAGMCDVGGPPPLAEVEPGHRVACHLFNQPAGGR